MIFVQVNIPHDFKIGISSSTARIEEASNCMKRARHPYK